jgi:DNA polymerase-3 subunit epsilon/ATP-dependent DNA helicase DinG
MMREIARSFNEGEHLIVEAGTGTGKSIAYLLPSISFSVENNAPVVISTNTINLQDQLIGKDIPDLIQALQRSSGSLADNLRVMQLKGRTNYLCMRKYENLMTSARLSIEEVKLLARVTVWLLSTESGDRAELNLAGNELATWNRLCAQFDERGEGQCKHRLRGTCFLHSARRAAEDSHIIVVNHALLLSDMVSDTKILPPYEHLIIDEAHHLENEATDQLGYVITQWDLLAYLRRFKQDMEGQRTSGLIAWINDCFRGSTVALSRQRQLKSMAEILGSHVDKAQVAAARFFERLRSFIESHTSDQGGYDRNLLLTWSKRTQPGWSRVEIASDDLNSVLKEIADELDRLYIGLEDLSDSKINEYDNLMMELSSLYRWTEELRVRMDASISHPEPESIYWLVIYGQNDGTGIHAAPLSVSRELERSLFSPKECVVLTGATLSTEGNFEYIRGRLGFDDTNELILGAPFDYEKSTMIYLPNDMPYPNGPGYQQEFERILIDICRVSRGRALALFTSHAALRATQAAIQSPLEEEGILVLGHGVDGSPKQLQAAFRENPEAVLLGAASFWEGIDVVGEALSVLVIARLPFNVPTDPVFSARSELFEDPFNQYTIPQAAIRFKQGFGRLIRSKSDRGIVVILDKRLQTKRYGSAFLDSIPQCTVVRGPSRELPSRMEKWLGWDSAG